MRKMKNKIEKGEKSLFNIVKLLLLLLQADEKGRQAAEIYHRSLKCGSDLDDEKKMSMAALKAARRDTEAETYGLSNRSSSLSWTAADCCNPVPESPGVIPTRASAGGPQTVDWLCGQPRHFRRLCPQSQGAQGTKRGPVIAGARS